MPTNGEEDAATRKIGPAKGHRVGGCVLERLLGRGGMGSVWESRQLSLDRPVAVKILSPEFNSDVGFVERFRREATIVARLNSPNIVLVHDAGVEGDLCYIIMERLEGESLQQRLENSGPLEENQALDLLGQVARGLAAAHEAGLVHRDIKPANIFLCRDGTYKLLDFGIAHDQTSEMTRTGEVLGTPYYMSPEHGEGKPVTAKSDLYALGATVYAALTGAPPFQASTPVAVLRMHLDEPPVPLRGIRPGLNSLVLRMMEKRPEDRPESAAQVSRDSQAIISGAAPSRLTLPRRGVRRLAFLALAVTGILFVASFATVALTKAEPTVVESPVVQKIRRFAAFRVRALPKSPYHGKLEIVLAPKPGILLTPSKGAGDDIPVARYAIDISPPSRVHLKKTEILYPLIDSERSFTVDFDVHERGDYRFFISITYEAMVQVAGTLVPVPVKSETVDFRLIVTVE